VTNLANQDLRSRGTSSSLAAAASAAMAVLVVLLPVHLAGCSADGSAPAGDAPKSALAPPLGTAQDFAVLGGSTVTNTGSSVITGDLGVSPGSAVTGFPPGLVTGGTIHAADAVALQAQNDTTTVNNALAGQACTSDLTGQDLGGLTLVPGVYCFSSSAQLTGALTLDAGGDSKAVWVFRAGSTLTTASSSSVLLTNGGSPCNVFWQVGSSATLGTSTSFVGHVIALTSITLTTGASVSGSILARNGAVTLDTNTIAASACAVAPATPIPPTLGKAFSPATIHAGEVSTLTITLSNADSAVASLTAPLVDTLTSGLVIAATPGAGTTCGGTAAATAGGSTVTLTGGSIPANGSCTVTVRVTAASAGAYSNSLPAGALQTSNGNSAAAAAATLTVILPGVVIAPTLGKTFGPVTAIGTGGVSTVTITLHNPNDTAASLTAPLTDTLPSGLAVAGERALASSRSTSLLRVAWGVGPLASNTCGGTFAPSAGDTTVTMTGGSIPANGSCTVQFDVDAPSGGVYVNTLPAGALQTSNGNSAAPAAATLTVNTPGAAAPTLGKTFGPVTILGTGGVSTVTITLTNPGNAVASLTAPLADTLPTGLMVAGEKTLASSPSALLGIAWGAGPAASNSCGGMFAPGAGDTTVTMTGGAIPANGYCTVQFDVYAPIGGVYVNTLPAGALRTSNGNSSAPAVATLTVP